MLHHHTMVWWYGTPTTSHIRRQGLFVEREKVATCRSHFEGGRKKIITRASLGCRCLGVLWKVPYHQHRAK